MGEKQCILVIDDTPMQLMIMGRALSNKYDVKMAKSGAEGLKLLTEHKIDLILLDLVMKGMSGFDVLLKLKENEDTKNIPVIFVTGSVSSTDEAKGLALGAVDYIRKPFTDIIINLRVKLHLQMQAQMRIIENLSLTDGLTGIYNRRGFDQNIRTVWSQAKRKGDTFSMLMIDIDHFKTFNDSYGHLNGDICLKIVAKTIEASLNRQSDSVYRWGGEEFAVLLPDTDIKGAMHIAERIRVVIEKTSIPVSGKNVKITVSIGAGTISPAPTDNDADFIIFHNQLDQALYQAKQSGRNRVQTI
ncbi:MAG: diguanylate cyclase [Defluviitaleaceae bacterium]|nr:diguanylate cyclase [Defluviitaleaceae bacterium]